MHPNERFADSLFWTLKSPEGATSVVAGTVHVIDTSHITMPTAVLEEHLIRLGHLYVEIAPEEMLELTTQMQETGLSALGPQGTGPATPEQLDRLYKFAADSPVLNPLSEQFPTLSTGVLTQLVRTAMQLRSPLFEEPRFEMENHFITVAAERDIPVTGLEQSADQFAHFDADSDLDAALDDYDAKLRGAESDEIFDMFTRYADQDLRLLSDAEQRSDTMIKRNAAMASALDTHLRDTPGLVLLGAAHLPYDTGVLALLADKGWEIDRVDLAVDKH